MSILFGLLLARRFYCRSALSLSPGRTGGLLPRINAPKRRRVTLILYQNYSSFMAPQTEIPLTGEMSRSDKRVTARCEQLEPVTGQEYCRATVLGADVALCISSCSPHPFFCHRQRGTVSQLTAAYGCS